MAQACRLFCFFPPTSNFLKLYVIHTVHVFKSIYYPTNALRDKLHMTYINSYTFRHGGVIFREQLQHGITKQPVNICCL